MADDPIIVARERIGEARRLNSSELDLRNLGLTALSLEIASLTQLQTLLLDANRLTALPPEIASLTQLKVLSLNNNQLSALPPEIASLTQLKVLSLDSNQLTALPLEIARLTELNGLLLNDNQLTALPPEIGSLTQLQTLSLDNNQLTALPPEIASLTQLQKLWLNDNQLTALPPEIASLTQLQHLWLDNSQLSALPAEIASLTQLQWLSLSKNQLTALPPWIASLTQLQKLWLNHNQLTALPPEIASLAQLQWLSLLGNELTSLPPEIASLAQLQKLSLNLNPLPTGLVAAASEGVPALFAYLRSLDDAEPSYEGKLLLLGDGNAGKTSCLHRLITGRFIERLTTHGIEIKPLSLAHPIRKSRKQLTINCWDFGGQDVYRVTHQFFYSPDAFYLLVWNPREKARREGLQDWLEQIRLRVGSRARVLLVATHAKSDRRGYRIDYTGLKEQYGDMLVDQVEIDSRSGTGFKQLKAVIAAEMIRLPHVGERISRKWLAAQQELLAHRPQTSRQVWEDIATRHGMPADQHAPALAWLHAIGRIVHFSDDLYLKEVIVTDPEWLTKAIGYLVADRDTLNSGGELAHARLSEIWLRHRDPHGPTYRPEHLPFLLRLTERFDITYRIPDRDDMSLVGELVPEALEGWTSWPADPGSAERHLALVGQLPAPLPGLMPRLIVRTHRYTTGRHWLRGVYLEHEKQRASALLELKSPTALHLTVRSANSALNLFEVLREHIDAVLASHYPEVGASYFVPCPGEYDGHRCDGRFALTNLERARERGNRQMQCHNCQEMQDVAALLTGFGTPREEMVEMLRRIDSRVEDLSAQAVLVRDVLRLVAEMHEQTDCPRLFTLEPVDRAAWNPKSWVERDYVLTLWCEHPEHEHPWKDARFELRLSRDWLVKTAPYIRVVAKAIKYGVPLFGAGAGMMLDDATSAATRDERGFADKVAGMTPADLEDGDRLPLAKAGERLEGMAFFEFRRLVLPLAEKKTPKFGDLRRVQDTTGRRLWMCPEHDAEVYNPPLVAVPEA